MTPTGGFVRVSCFAIPPWGRLGEGELLAGLSFRVVAEEEADVLLAAGEGCLWAVAAFADPPEHPGPILVGHVAPLLTVPLLPWRSAGVRV